LTTKVNFAVFYLREAFAGGLLQPYQKGVAPTQHIWTAVMKCVTYHSSLNAYVDTSYTVLATSGV
jgi:hypothetical protein